MENGLAKVREFIEWAYGLLRRQIHNRITLTLVIVGAATAINPWWAPYLTAVVNRALGTDVEIETSPWVGVAIIALALLYHWGAMRSDGAVQQAARISEQEALRVANERRRTHDLAIANRFREILPENRKQGLQNRLYHEHACFSSQLNVLDEVMHFLATVEARFLDADIRAAASEFVRRSHNLTDFIGRRFFTYPEHLIGDCHQFAMQPNWNIDRGGTGRPEDDRRYAELTDELGELLSAWDEAYDRLITAFHERLV